MVYFASFSDSSRVPTPRTLSRSLEAQNAERTSEINGFLDPLLNVFLLAHFSASADPMESGLQHRVAERETLLVHTGTGKSTFIHRQIRTDKRAIFHPIVAGITQPHRDGAAVERTGCVSDSPSDYQIFVSPNFFSPSTD